MVLCALSNCGCRTALHLMLSYGLMITCIRGTRADPTHLQVRALLGNYLQQSLLARRILALQTATSCLTAFPEVWQQQ